MPTKLREIINVSLALLLDQELLSSNDQVEAFHQALDVDFRQEVGMAANVATGETHPTRIFDLHRDRIILNLSRVRTVITREFPSLDTLDRDLSRFAEVTDHILRTTDLSEVRCDFGYNVDMVFDQDTKETALEFLGERLLNYDALNQPGRELVGGTCRIIVKDESGQWTYNLEPRAGDLQRKRVFVGTNLHKQESLLPGKDEITSSIESVVNSVIELMCRLDERVQNDN